MSRPHRDVINPYRRWHGTRRYGAQIIDNEGRHCGNYHIGNYNDCERDDEDSVLMKRPSETLDCHAGARDEGTLRKILDAFSCLCVGTAPRDMQDDLHYMASSSTLCSLDTPVAVSPRDIGHRSDVLPDNRLADNPYRTTSHLVHPVPCMSDPLGAYVERPEQMRSSSSPSKFFFRPVSEDESCVGIDGASRQQPWET